MMPLLELAALMGAIVLAIRAVVRYRVARPNARDRWEPAALLGMANVASLFLVGLLIGGSAVLGKVVAGRYFVGDHGHYRRFAVGLDLQLGTCYVPGRYRPFHFHMGVCASRGNRG